MAGSLAGLLAMGLLLYAYKVREIEIEELKEQNGEDLVKLKRTITSLKDMGKFSVLEIGHQAEISVTLFDDGILDLNPGERVSIEGRIQEFQGRKQLVADEITRVK